MPSSSKGTNLTYKGNNTKISGDVSRSGCVVFRANAVNYDNIIFEIGSSFTTWNNSKGCNTHFALAIYNASHVTVYGMCSDFDNSAIPVGRSNLQDSQLHQLCVTYDNKTDYLCVYLDLSSPQCLRRLNPPYNTSLGDVRIGWWPDGNRQFNASGGGLIRSLSLFNTAINQSCVSYIFNNNFS